MNQDTFILEKGEKKMDSSEKLAQRFEKWRNGHPLAWTVILIVSLVILAVLFFVIKAIKTEGYPEIIPLYFGLALLIPLSGAVLNVWKFYRANNQKNFDLSLPDS